MLDGKEKVGHAVHFLGIDALPVLVRYCHQIVVAPGAWLQLVQSAVSAQCCNVHSVEVNLVGEGVKVIKRERSAGVKIIFHFGFVNANENWDFDHMVMVFKTKDNYAQSYTDQCLSFY